MLKRFAGCLFAVMLLMSGFTAAGAEGAPEPDMTVKAVDASLNEVTDTLAVKLENTYYYRLMDAYGQVLVGEDQKYTTMYFSTYGFIKVETEVPDGIHRKGLLNGYGSVLVPSEYADIDMISDRWQAGIRLTPSTADDKDYTYTNYSSGEKSFFRVDTVDLFFDGEKVGTLSRSDYSSATAYNAYLGVTNQARERHYYNSRLELSPVEGASGEFTSTYNQGKTTYVHNGSGQQAFVSSCTLNPDDLVNPYLYEKGVLYDLQGNQVFKTEQRYDSMRPFYNGYAVVRLDSLSGLIDRNGHEVIHPEYSDFPNAYDPQMMEFGFLAAAKDGKYGFLDAKGNVTCPFVYSNEAVSSRGTFGSIKNLDGTIIVLTAGGGELQEHFEEVSFVNSTGAYAFVGKNSDGESCVIDLYGNTLVPYGTGARYLYTTVDGRVALASYGSRQYGIFYLDTTPGEKVETAEAPAASQEEAASWTCENGHSGNTGKFCTECGAARPAEEEVITKCPNCGYEFGDSVPKFCPECGTKIQ